MLTDKEILSIEAFCSNQEMYDAVKKVLLEGIFSHGVIEKGGTFDPLVNGAFSLVSLSTQNPIPNEEIGAQLRAQWAGINALENSYKKLKTIKSIKGDEILGLVNEGV